MRVKKERGADTAVPTEDLANDTGAEEEDVDGGDGDDGELEGDDGEDVEDADEGEEGEDDEEEYIYSKWDKVSPNKIWKSIRDKHMKKSTKRYREHSKKLK